MDMKKLIVSFIFLACAFGAAPLHAQTPTPVALQQSGPHYRSGDVVVLKQDETINKDFFAAGENVRISGTVNGDLYVAGGTVTIDGTVNGDVLAAGGTIDLSGSVLQDARLVGGTIDVSGTVGQNLSMVGGTSNLQSRAQLAGNIVTVGGTILVDSAVNGNLMNASQELTISKSVRGDVDSISENLDIMEQATIGGNLSYASAEPANLDESAVSGTVTEMEFPRHDAQSPQTTLPAKKAFEGFFTFMSIVWILANTLIGLLIIYVLPHFTHNVASMIQTKPWHSIGLGLVAAIVSPIVAVLLMVTLVGFPLGLILMFALFVSFYISQFFVMYWFGQLVVGKLNKQWHDGWIFVVGMVLYTALKWVPIIGWVFHMLAMLAGFGALIFTKKELLKTLKTKKLL